MIKVEEAAKKIAGARHDVGRAKAAWRTHADDAAVKAAERRFVMLLRMFIQFKDSPEFNAEYAREWKALGRGHLPSPT